tara:strand:+ start:158 stop:439 length:282 start_codon:yes stop_codon:yes gene_type:complete
LRGEIIFTHKKCFTLDVSITQENEQHSHFPEAIRKDREEFQALIMCRCLTDRWKEEEALQITDQDIDWGSLTRFLTGFGRNSLGLPDPECTYS